MTDRSKGSPEKNQGVQLSLKGNVLLAGFVKEVEDVTEVLLNADSSLVNIKISYRGPGDYLAILKRYDDDGTPTVIFGSGVDFITALLGLETAVGQDKWRPDKYALAAMKDKAKK